MDKEPDKILRIVHVNKDIETPKTIEQLQEEIDLLTAQFHDEATPATEKQQLFTAISNVNKKILELTGIIKGENDLRKT
jgi:hypothetical protein